VVERRFLRELIALENRLSRGYGDGQPREVSGRGTPADSVGFASSYG
jgi:hypothetical protein